MGSSSRLISTSRAVTLTKCTLLAASQVTNMSSSLQHVSDIIAIEKEDHMTVAHEKWSTRERADIQDYVHTCSATKTRPQASTNESAALVIIYCGT